MQNRNIRVRGILVRRLFWVEEIFSSNLNNPIIYKDNYITKGYVYTLLIILSIYY
jgi:hypothetical protein